MRARVHWFQWSVALSALLTGLNSAMQALDLAGKEEQHAMARLVFAGLQRSIATVLMLHDNASVANVFQGLALQFQVRAFLRAPGGCGGGLVRIALAAAAAEGGGVATAANRDFFLPCSRFRLISFHLRHRKPNGVLRRFLVWILLKILKQSNL